MKKLFALSTLLFAAACGDDNPGTPDAGVTPDMQNIDAAIDAPVWTAPTPFAINVSATGPDQVMSAAPGPNGTFYIAGYTAANATAGTAKFIFVAKLTAAGALDTTFAGGTGIYTSDVELKGGSDEIDIVVQSTGKIVVATTIANDVTATDKDVGVFRVNADGTRDATFALTTSLSRINLSTAYNDNGTLRALDASRGLALGPNDTLFLHAASRDMVADAGASIDTDFTVAKLSAEGILDTNYGTTGKTLIDINNKDATVRGIHAFSDGSVLAGGYARTTISNDTAQPVLYRLNADGDLDPSFNSGAPYHEIVLTKQTEIYGFAVHTNDVTTAGYGNESTTADNVYTPMRFNAATGARLTTFGGATNGVPLLDPSGGTAGNNNRGAVALPGGKTALFGSTGDSGGRDGAVVILTQNGQLDTSYGTGIVTWDLGGTEDQWWSGAVNGGKLLIVGWKGVGATQTDAANDGSYGVLIDIE